MKILLVSGAGSIHTIRWANAFAGADIDVHLVSQQAPIEPLHSRVSLHRLPHLAAAGYILNGPRLRGLIRDLKPDIVNAHYASGSGTLARWVTGVPYVLNVWGSDVFDFPEKSRLHRWLVRGNLAHADAVASTSEMMAARTRIVAPNLGSVAVTPFGVDTLRFRPKERVQREVRSMGGKIVIGTVKILAAKYGIDTLLRAFRALRDRLEHSDSSLEQKLELRIVGDGPERAPLTRLAVDLAIDRATTFVGRVPHERVPEELARLDIFCVLSRSDSESFGVAAIEASAVGLPIVVSDAGGLPEVIVEGETGFVVRRNDADAAAAALEKLVVSPELCKEMGRAGRQNVRQKYEWTVCVARMISLFRETISRWNSRN